ncbi:hypothetical protein PENTCL1PPCAC_4070, partial [Pristionchus entomophagus]
FDEGLNSVELHFSQPQTGGGAVSQVNILRRTQPIDWFPTRVNSCCISPTGTGLNACAFSRKPFSIGLLSMFTKSVCHQLSSQKIRPFGLCCCGEIESIRTSESNVGEVDLIKHLFLF